MHMMCYSACIEVCVIYIVAEIGIVSVIVRCIERPCDNYMFVCFFSNKSVNKERLSL